MPLLEIKNLSVQVAGNKVVKDFSLKVDNGQTHAIMGPNGSGKSSLAKAIAGHEDYKILSGEVLLDGENLLELEVDERARAGFFLAFQYPMGIPGVSIANFLRAARQARLGKNVEIDIVAFYNELYAKMAMLEMDKSFSSRALNDGFSGGEKKRCEILQMAMLEPKFAILDETDSGLDIDALKTVSRGVNAMRDDKRGFLVITHYQRLLNYIVPDKVHVMARGKIIRSGDKNLALELEERGYEWLLKEEDASV